jgi:hypothetical protein
MNQIDLTVYGSHDMSDSTSSNYNMLMDAPADSAGGKPGKHVKYKVGFHGKGNGADVYQANSDDDSIMQTASAEQQNLKDAAGQAKAEADSGFVSEKDKRQKTAELKAQKKAEKKQKQADQKAKDQG